MYIYYTSNLSTNTGSELSLSFRRRVFPEEVNAAKAPSRHRLSPWNIQCEAQRSGYPTLGDVVL